MKSFTIPRFGRISELWYESLDSLANEKYLWSCLEGFHVDFWMRSEIEENYGREEHEKW